MASLKNLLRPLPCAAGQGWRAGRWLTVLLLLAAAHAFAAGGGVHLDRAPIKPQDRVSLQRGAAIFVNHCMGCHGASFLRHSTLQELGISEALIKENLMFSAEKIGEPMLTSMSARHSREWFGVAPPDLTLVARARGEDWLYSYMRGFHRDSSRPTGWNNVVFPNVAMPHVLYQFQGARTLQIEEERSTIDAKTHKASGGERVITVFDEHGDKTVKTQKLEHIPAHASAQHKFTVTTAGEKSALEYDQMVADVVNFLSWAGEPAKVQRLRTGAWVMIYLAILLGLAYAMKRAFWKDIH